MTKSYYDILEVDKTASTKEIKTSFRKLVKKYHPDVSKEENAEEQFKLIQEAHDILSDEKKRSEYDNVGHEKYKQYTNSNANYDSYKEYSEYSTSNNFSPINLKEWFNKRSILEKILLIIFSIFIIFIIIIIGIIFLIYKIISSILKAFTGKR